MKRIGQTRKVSLTLPQELWEHLETEYNDMSMSSAIRDMLENYYIVLRVKGLIPRGTKTTDLDGEQLQLWEREIKNPLPLTTNKKPV